MAIVVIAAAIGAVIAIAQTVGESDDASPDSPSTTFVAVPIRSAPAAPTDGDAFTDPQGSYSITLGADWTDLPSTMVAEVETWAVGDRDRGFTPNVNVLTQDAAGMDPDQYMDLSIDSIDSIDGELVDHAFVTGASGTSLGLIEYIAQPPGVRGDLHFIAVFDLRRGTAVVATYTATLDQFDELLPTVEPYLLTLEATG